MQRVVFFHYQISWTFAINQMPCVIMSGGKDTHPWSATKGGNPSRPALHLFHWLKRKSNTMLEILSHVTLHTLESPSRTVLILFQESWMIKTCPNCQEVQQFWQTEAIFQTKETMMSLHFYNLFNNFSSYKVFSNTSAYDFGPSGVPRMIISSFVAVLSFREIADSVDSRFSVMSPRKEITFMGLILSPSVCSASTVFLRSCGTVL